MSVCSLMPEASMRSLNNTYENGTLFMTFDMLLHLGRVDNYTFTLEIDEKQYTIVKINNCTMGE